MNFENPLGTEIREVGDVRHNGQPARAVRCSRIYPTDAMDLWEALTDQERLPRWFLPIDGDLQVGGRYQLEGNAGGTIERCDRPDALDVTWEYGGNVSWVRLRLAPEGAGCRLTLVHIVPKDEANEEHWAQYGPGATGVGWDLSFFGLGLHLELPDQPVDPEALMEWSASEPGRDFARACAKAWGEVHEAAGEDSEVAEEMAARTAAFYSGE